MTSTAVRVGLRVRPLTEKERINNCTECLSFIPNEPQILIGTDKSFTYDYVFESSANQAQVYSSAASPLLHKFIDGFNATILAYGQTGSGKTFSMGTSLDNTVSAENEGIVPRCIVELFQVLKAQEKQDEDYKFQVYVSFLELYNEEFIDLLNTPQQSKRRSTLSTPNQQQQQQQQQQTNANTKEEVSIREDIAGNIYWSGVKEELCYSPEEVLGYLAQGSLGRTTGSTEMNSVSSRSHAIFSVILKQQKPEQDETGKKVIKSLNSKFHFVDLAGSERLKRTHAQGDRAKEGIAINSGLLALGNVISALGDEARRATHIPYRDSKLTRLLQDSLGGNSQTLMLACVSPADTNFMETLNTLKYANRARNIKNRVTVNQDFAGSSMEVNQLKALVSRLRMEIASLRADGHSMSTANTSQDDSVSLKNESARLRDRLQDMSNRLVQVTSERDTLLMERELGEFMQNDSLEDDTLLENVNTTKRIQTHPIIESYQKQIQDLTTELQDTKDKLKSMETTVAAANQALAAAKPTKSTSSVLQKFSNSTASASSRNGNNMRRKKVNTRLVPDNSSTNGYAAKITTKITRRPIITKSTSASLRNKRHNRYKKKSYKQQDYEEADTEEDEGYVNDLQDDEVRHEEVKESIAKVRADIRKSLEVLELVKPLEDSNTSWEDELKAFEAVENRLHDINENASSDEGMYSLTPSPVDDDYGSEIEALAVPAWNNHGRSNDKLDTSVSSKPALSLDSKQTFTSSATTSNIHSKYAVQLSRMLHQIQSDIKVKEELVAHLEKSETEYTFMRKKFDEKISHLQAQLSETQKEKDIALMRTKSGFAIKTDIANYNLQQQVAASRGTLSNAAIDKQSNEIRHVYEVKMKNLMSEIQDLKRKYSHATMAMQSNRNQNESMLKSLRTNVETLKVEKRQLMHRMKAEAERVRSQISQQERRIQQLQRQHAKSNQAKKRLEREHEQQKSALKKRNEEIMISSSQLKQLTSILKKAVREGGILDEKMLNKASPIMGGSFAVIARGGGHGFPKRQSKKKNPIPLGIRVSRKKELLDKALCQYIQGKQAVVEMEQLLVRREHLISEKFELEEERDHVFHVENELEENTGQPMDIIAIELMDERIDLIAAEIAYLSARIRTLQSEAAEEALQAEESGATLIKNMSPRPPKHVTFVDEILNEPVANNDEWADIDSFDDQFCVPANAAPEMAYDITSKLIKSFEADECKRIIENLVDDIMDLRMNEYSRQVTVQNLEKSVVDLRRTLIVMKRAAISSTIDSERRIRQLEAKEDGMHEFISNQQDVSLEEYISGNTIFDRIYEDGLRGLITETSESAYEQQPTSPIVSPQYNKATSNAVNKRLPLPVQMVETLSKSTTLGREVTPSPDRFYNMIQKRLSWQQEQEGRDSMTPEYEAEDQEEEDLLRAVSAAAAKLSAASGGSPDFGQYMSDHESSTSSIRSSHLRRSSVQSDMSSLSSWNQKSTGRVSSSNNQFTPTVNNPVRRDIAVISPLLAHAQNMPRLNTNDLENIMSHQQLSPQSTNSMQHQNVVRRPLPPLMPSLSTFDRPTTPSVFDRLAQTPTRASRAKVNYRHSSSSVDDLRKKWEVQQRPSSVLGNSYM